MNIALIGLGMVADTHVAAIADSPGLHLKWVMGRDADRTAAFAARYDTHPPNKANGGRLLSAGLA